MADAFQGTSGASNATQSVHPRQWMTPGWYWKFLEPSEAGATWSSFTNQNPAIRTTKTVGTGHGTATERGAWVLFEVTGKSPVLWTLPGLPSKAIKGAATEYQDVVDLGEDEKPGCFDSVESLLVCAGDELKTAGKVLLWGGIAIVLWRVFQATDVVPRRSKKELPA